MSETHEHDWRPDGESFTVKTCNCDGDRYHKLLHRDHYKRVRRYTCHCGEAKVVDIEAQ